MVRICLELKVGALFIGALIISKSIDLVYLELLTKNFLQSSALDIKNQNLLNMTSMVYE